MLEMPRINVGPPRRPAPETRAQMIRQTSAFLSRALHAQPPLPRIPRRRMDQGGFARLLREPGFRGLAERWWDRVLDALPRD